MMPSIRVFLGTRSAIAFEAVPATRYKGLLIYHVTSPMPMTLNIVLRSFCWHVGHFCWVIINQASRLKHDHHPAQNYTVHADGKSQSKIAPHGRLPSLPSPAQPRTAATKAPLDMSKIDSGLDPSPKFCDLYAALPHVDPPIDTHPFPPPGLCSLIKLIDHGR